MKNRNFFHPGWIIVGFSFITLSLVYGVWYSFSVFFVALLKEFGWSRSITAGAFSLCIIIHGVIGPFVGGMADRLGPRRVILLGSFILGIGLALCSLLRTWWQFYLFFGVITAAGIGSTGWVAHVTLIQRWFKAKRGLAIGIISSGIGIGILVCIPTIQYLIIQLGWRIAYLIMAIFIPLVVISMTIAFLKRLPKAIPDHPVEMKTAQTIMRDPFIVDDEWASRSWTLQKAIRTRQFWLLGLFFFLANLIIQSIFAHQVAFFVDQGLEALFASYIVGIIGVVSVGSKILWGGLSDRIGREITYTMGIICFMIGIFILILFSMIPSLNLTYIFSLLFGTGYAVTAVLPPLIAADFFEGKSYGSIFGTLHMLNGLGGAFGPWFAGFVHDRIGSYIPFFLTVILCAFFSCLIIWKAAPRKVKLVPGGKVKMRIS